MSSAKWRLFRLGLDELMATFVSERQHGSKPAYKISMHEKELTTHISREQIPGYHR